MVSRKLKVVILALAVGLGACQGPSPIEDVPGEPGPVGGTVPPDVTPPVDPPDEIPEPPSCDVPSPGPSPLRRLTRTEYDNTIRDLFDDDRRFAENTFPPDGTVLGYPTPVPMTSRIAELYRDAAEAIAAEALVRWAAVITCEAGEAAEAECAANLINTVGTRAYRAPLAAEQADAIFGVYAAAREAGDDYQNAIGQTIAAVLQSPFFLYRLEFGSADVMAGTDTVVGLTPHELASRLSYLIWNSMPDQALFDAAAADALETTAQVEAQARRMLTDDKARKGITQFFMQWFEVESILDALKDDAAFPDFDDEVREAMLAETEAFVEHVIWEDGASLDTLLDAPYTFVNERLAEFYGIEGVTGDAFVQVDTEGVRPNGILGHGSLLAAHATPSTSSPVLRGMFVRSRMFCQDVPPPPPNLEVIPPDPEPGLTTRELYESQHAEEDYCAGCHRMMDPIGFGFEHFDAVGLFRDTEVGKPIDDSGHLVGTDVDGDFDGIEGLTDVLTESDQVRECVANQWFRFAFGRMETLEDTCSTKVMVDALADTDNDLIELVVALTRSDSFRFRHAIVAEGGN